MENFALIALTEAIKREADGMVVRRVVQHHANGFIFQTRVVRMPALKVLLDARTPAMYVSGIRPPVESVGSDFLMVLRKHIGGARLLEVEKPLSERIVELRFRTSLPAKELERVTLILELIPNAPNLLLLDQARRVLASFRPLSPQHGIGAFDIYRYPPNDKIELASTRTDRSWFDENGFEEAGTAWLIRTITGMGPVFAGEIVHRHKTWGRLIPDELKDLLNQITQPTAPGWIYTETPLSVILERNDLAALGKAVLSPVELESLRRTHSAQTYLTMLEAARFLHDEREARLLLERAKKPRLRGVRAQIRRLNQRRNRLVQRREQFNEAAELQTTAQMLVSSGAAMDQRHESVAVTDYFGDEPRTRTIPLDKSRTLRENTTRMFKRCRKAARGGKMVENQLNEVENLDRKLRKEEERIRAITNWDAWMASGGSSKTARPGSVSGRTKGQGGTHARRGRSIEIDGHEVLVGRNSRENDELTFRVASGDDFWLHVADYSGSHVIVRNPSRESELKGSLLVRVAQLAAYHSQARNSNKVEVHYTRRKFVSKPRKARPGLVTLREFQTIKVEPRDWVPGEAPAPDAGDNGSGEA